MVFDAQGKKRAQHVGQPSYEAFRAMIEAALATEDEAGGIKD